jgi:Initiator Replication protein
MTSTNSLNDPTPPRNGSEIALKTTIKTSYPVQSALATGPGSRRRERGPGGFQHPALLMPQSLIHIKHTLTLRQIKYFYLFFEEMRLAIESGTEPDNLGFYSMTMDRLSRRMGYTPIKSQVWEDLRSLKNQTVAVNLLMKDGETVHYGAGYLAEWAVSNSTIRFKFPSFFVAAAQNFVEFKRLFLQLNWEIFNSLSGKHEAVIYKLCRDYLNSSGKRTPSFTVSAFRNYMGIEDHEYTDFRRLSTRVIHEPVKKINDNPMCDLMIEPVMITEGRKVVGLYFTFKEKGENVLVVDMEANPPPFNQAKRAIPAKFREAYLKTHTEDEARACILAANEWAESLRKKNEPVNFGAIYRRALMDNWRPNLPIDAKDLTSVSMNAGNNADDGKGSDVDTTFDACATPNSASATHYSSATSRAMAAKQAADDEAATLTAQLNLQAWQYFLDASKVDRDKITQDALKDAPFSLEKLQKMGSDNPIIKAYIIGHVRKLQPAVDAV